MEGERAGRGAGPAAFLVPSVQVEQKGVGAAKRGSSRGVCVAYIVGDVLSRVRGGGDEMKAEDKTTVHKRHLGFNSCIYVEIDLVYFHFRSRRPFVSRKIQREQDEE